MRSPSPFAESPEFRRLLRREPASDLDLVRVALEIARDARPGLDIEHYLAAIAGLAERARGRCAPGAKPRATLGQINWVLFVEEGFRGNRDDYYDPENSHLDRVIDRKLGIPITLSVLYAAVAGRLGLDLSGVNLPAHFMLRHGRGDATVFVDPFHEGALLDRRGCEERVAQVVGRPVALSDLQLAPCGPDLIVTRMLRNLKAIYLERREFAEALPVLRRLAALNPGLPDEQRDFGTLCLRLDRPAEAVAPLRAYLDARPRAEDAELVASLLRSARREAAARN